MVKAMNDPVFTDWAKKSGTPIDPGDAATAVKSASNVISHVEQGGGRHPQGAQEEVARARARLPSGGDNRTRTAQTERG